MYVLVGKTLIENNQTFHQWIVGVADDPVELEIRKERIENTLKDFNCFLGKDGPFTKKQNLLYSECLKIVNILNKLDLDKGCDFISNSGFTYEIVKTKKIKETF